jgi:hypothetical protein
MSETTGQTHTKYKEGKYSVMVTQYLTDGIIAAQDEYSGTIRQCLKCIENLFYYEEDWAFAYKEPYIEVNAEYIFQNTKTAASSFAKFHNLQDKLKIFVKEKNIKESLVSYSDAPLIDWEEIYEDCG